MKRSKEDQFMSEMINLTAEDGHKLAAYKATPSGTPRGALVVPCGDFTSWCSHDANVRAALWSGPCPVFGQGVRVSLGLK